MLSNRSARVYWGEGREERGDGDGDGNHIFTSRSAANLSLTCKRFRLRTSYCTACGGCDRWISGSVVRAHPTSTSWSDDSAYAIRRQQRHCWSDPADKIVTTSDDTTVQW